MKEKNLKSLIALTLIPGLGARRISQIARAYSDAHRVFKLNKLELQRITGIGESSALSIAQFDDWDKVDRVIQATEEIGASIIGINDVLYPEKLRHIYDPPALLWVKGDPSVLQKEGVAVIGTRRPTAYGRKLAAQFSTDLVKSGLAVFSGMAYGIDAIAHKECLNQQGITVAVLGSGLDELYPKRNTSLAELIIEKGGAVITEYPPGTKPDAGNFPERNRIVSGLSMGVLVIESAIQGGSMITAEIGLDQNKEVFAIPHMLDNASGAGCNYLIKSGQAKLVQTISDVLEELPVNYKVPSEQHIEKPNRVWKTLELNELSNKICCVLEGGPAQIDTLSEKLALSSSQLHTELLQLEMKKAINQKAGKIFTLN